MFKPFTLSNSSTDKIGHYLPNSLISLFTYFGILGALTICMIDYTLNTKIFKLAPKFEAKDIAPNSFIDLKVNSLETLVVWSGASDQTIYGDAKVNWAFRAWHDALHLELNAPFTFEGEKLVALEQARLIGSDQLGNILMAEIVGQTEFYNKYGYFPVDQVKFIQDYLKGVL